MEQKRSKMNYFLNSVLKLIILIVFWPLTITIKLYTNYKTHIILTEFKTALRDTDNYEDWILIATKIDEFLGKDKWRQRDESKKYDYKLIQDRVSALKEATREQDVNRMISVFNSGLVRNFGGITDKYLFNNSYLGTKHLIQEYILEVVNCLKFISLKDDDKRIEFDNLKLRFFQNSKRSFGSTSLILQGGSILGMYHLGVIKTLNENHLLPKIITGSYFGSLFASLICSFTDPESLNDFINNVSNVIIKFELENGNKPNSKTRKKIDQTYDPNRDNVDEEEEKEHNIFNEPNETCLKFLISFYKKNYTPEIYLLYKYVCYRLGDLTFEELYGKSGKILNIVVYSSDKSIPSLMNYITTPNVLVTSAIRASIGSEIFEGQDIDILVKNLKNEIVKLNKEEVSDDEPTTTLNETPTSEPEYKFLAPHELVDINIESPYERLTELFNVNHFIVSLARLNFKPLIINDIRHDLHFARPLEERIEEQVERVIIEETKNVAPLSTKQTEMMDTVMTPVTNMINLFTKNMIRLTNLISAPSYTYIKFSKNLQKVVNMEIQYRFNLICDLTILKNVKVFQMLKKLTVDEKTPSLSSSEITIVPKISHFVKSWRQISLINEVTEENLDYSIKNAILSGSRSVWPLLPILKVRCTIEYELDDLCTYYLKDRL